MKSSSGMTLWEVLMSLTLISILLLGTLSLQNSSLRLSSAALLASIAWHQIEGFCELLMMQDNQDIHKLFQHWHTMNSKILPKGKGTLSGTYPYYVVTVVWGNAAEDCRNNKIDVQGCLKFTCLPIQNTRV